MHVHVHALRSPAGIIPLVAEDVDRNEPEFAQHVDSMRNEVGICPRIGGNTGAVLLGLEWVSAVDFAAVADRYDKDRQPSLVELDNEPVVSDAEAPEFFVGRSEPLRQRTGIGMSRHPLR
nr:hypothetical protein [Chelativorans sp. ZYF759]